MALEINYSMFSYEVKMQNAKTAQDLCIYLLLLLFSYALYTFAMRRGGDAIAHAHSLEGTLGMLYLVY